MITNTSEEVGIALSRYVEDNTLHAAHCAGETIAVNSYVTLGKDGKVYETVREGACGIAKNNAKCDGIVVVKSL